MLHLHNGDSSAETARRAGLPGDHLAWREALVCGPTPAGVSSEEFLKIRARHLSSAYSVRPEECEVKLRRQYEALSKYAKHDEVVLWFEHDLFCQVQLIYLLDWFWQRDLRQTRLSTLR